MSLTMIKTRAQLHDAEPFSSTRENTTRGLGCSWGLSNPYAQRRYETRNLHEKMTICRQKGCRNSSAVSLLPEGWAEQLRAVCSSSQGYIST